MLCLKRGFTPEPTAKRRRIHHRAWNFTLFAYCLQLCCWLPIFSLATRHGRESTSNILYNASPSLILFLCSSYFLKKPSPLKQAFYNVTGEETVHQVQNLPTLLTITRRYSVLYCTLANVFFDGIP